jgi:rhodanese-related sulfurtransferase
MIDHSLKNISSLEAWGILVENPDAVLVDVRTMAEWVYVGQPDLTELGKQTLTIEWVRLSGQLNADFNAQLMAQVPIDKTIILICRSGVRSQAAGQAALQMGYQNVAHAADGFEGTLDRQGHRKTVSGWCFSGLPWTQT